MFEEKTVFDLMADYEKLTDEEIERDLAQLKENFEYASKKLAEAEKEYETLHAIFKEKMHDPNCSKEESLAAGNESSGAHLVFRDWKSTAEELQSLWTLEKEVYDKRHSAD